jgi:integrase
MPLQDEQLSAVRASKSRRPPTVLSRSEALTVIEHLRGTYKLMTQIMDGSGLRVMGTLRLRVKDLDFANQHIVVRDGKGEKDRLMAGRTAFVIAHRLSTIRKADQMLVIDDGRIIERGDHESLLAQRGFYYNLYMSQYVHLDGASAPTAP